MSKVDEAGSLDDLKSNFPLLAHAISTLQKRAEDNDAFLFIGLVLPRAADHDPFGSGQWYIGRASSSFLDREQHEANAHLLGAFKALADKFKLRWSTPKALG